MTDLATLKTPGPTTTALTRPFWDAAAAGKLIFQRCRSCGEAILYPRGICPQCWSDDLTWEEASGRGRLKSFSAVHKPGHPGWQPITPYVVGLVELVEGPTMLSFIHTGNQAARVGEDLILTPTPIGGRMLPAFSLTTAGVLSMSETKDGWAGTIKGRPSVGQFAERSRTTRMADIIAFTEMTGDRNPVHYDKELAEKTSFGKLIVQGGVTTGILNAVVAEDLPGPGTVFLGVEWKFVKAVGIDEEIIGRVEVAEVRADKPICKLKTEVRNGAGEVCLTGTATTYTMPLVGL